MSRSSRLLHIRSKPLSTLAAPPPQPLPSASARTPPRLPHEAPKQHHHHQQSHHAQLALTSPTQSLQPSLFPASGGPSLPPPFSLPSSPRPAQGTAAPTQAEGEGDFSLQNSQEDGARPRAAKRPRLAYRLDAGAYGIPKTRPGGHAHPYTDPAAYPTAIPSLAVQVGEDAYFLRENAMGVADGVGGWAVRAASSSASASSSYTSKSGASSATGSRSRSSCVTASGPTPSAMFARRLMHYCSAEISLFDERRGTFFKNKANSDSDEYETPGTRAPSTAFSFAHPLKPPRSPPTVVPEEDTELYETLPDTLSELSLEETLEDLSDGIDVLQILERAYDSTVRAHAPLTTGSSTALVAVLDAASPAYMRSPTSQSIPGSAPGPSSTHVSPEDLAFRCAPGVEENYAVGALWRETHGLNERRDGDTREKGRDKIAEDDSGMAGVKHGVDGASQGLSNLASGTATNGDGDSTYAHHGNGVRNIQRTDGEEFDAVVHIAHVGDCMGMLVRGDEIAWRTDEMWWGYNYPLQLGPPQVVRSSGSGQGTSKASTSGSVLVEPRQAADSTPTKSTLNARSQPDDSQSHRQKSPIPAARRGSVRSNSPMGVQRACYHTDAPAKSGAPGLSCENGNTTLPAPYMPIQTPKPATTSTSTSTSTETTSMSITSTPISAMTPKEENTLIPPPVRAHTFTLPVRADDIIILASDGLADNLWDEDVLDEVVRVRGAMIGDFSADGGLAAEQNGRAQGAGVTGNGIGTNREGESDLGTREMKSRGIGSRGSGVGATTRALADLLSSSSFESATASSSNLASRGLESPVPLSSPPAPYLSTLSSPASTPSTFTDASLATVSPITQDTTLGRATIPPPLIVSSLPISSPFTSSPLSSPTLGASSTPVQSQEIRQLEALRVRRTAFARTLAEALCSRAKRVSERRGSRHCSGSGANAKDKERAGGAAPYVGSERKETPAEADEVPFARRAKMAGRSFRGGKCDDISVLVAVVSPAGVPVPISHMPATPSAA